MRLLLHDTLATAFFVRPLMDGWVTAETDVEARPSLRADDVSSDELALVPSAEIALLQEAHVVVPDVAVVAEQIGLVAMRAPLRPDEVGVTPVRLWNVSGAAEILARATIQPFYGITPSAWIAEESMAAQVVVVEGASAIQLPEAGFTEDLVRAWFILSGQPYVSHVLVAPKNLAHEDLVPALAELAAARDTAHVRRRDLRRSLAEQYDLDRDRLATALNAQRYQLEDGDRRALLMLLQRGNRESRYPYPWTIPYLGESAEAEDMG